MQMQGFWRSQHFLDGRLIQRLSSKAGKLVLSFCVSRLLILECKDYSGEGVEACNILVRVDLRS